MFLEQHESLQGGKKGLWVALGMGRPERIYTDF